MTPPRPEPAASTVELEIRGVRPPAHGALPAAALLCLRGDAARGLSLQIGVGDAHTLLHELRGEDTPRAQAVRSLGCVAEALGGRVTAARLVSDGPSRLTAVLEVHTPAGSVEVPTAPGQALAAALLLQVPLLADGDMLGGGQQPAPVLGGAVAAFLDALDLRALDEEAP